MFHDIAGHEELTDRIIGCGMRVHDEIGPGVFESVYEACLLLELRAARLQVEQGRPTSLSYRGQQLHQVFIPDLIVEGVVIVEVKAVDRLAPVHQTQLITYLKLTGCPVGLLMNFQTHRLKSGIKRVVRPDLFSRTAMVPRPSG